MVVGETEQPGLKEKVNKYKRVPLTYDHNPSCGSESIITYSAPSDSRMLGEIGPVEKHCLLVKNLTFRELT